MKKILSACLICLLYACAAPQKVSDVGSFSESAVIPQHPRQIAVVLITNDNALFKKINAVLTQYQFHETFETETKITTGSSWSFALNRWPMLISTPPGTKLNRYTVKAEKVGNLTHTSAVAVMQELNKIVHEAAFIKYEFTVE